MRNLIYLNFRRFRQFLHPMPMRNKILMVLLFFSAVCSAQNLSNGLTACYPLDGNAQEPNNFLTGIPSAVTPTVDRFSNSGSALAFSGSTVSYVTLPNNALIKPTTYVSIAGWFKSNMVGDQMLVFAFNGCGSYFEGYCLAFDQNGSAMRALAVKANGACS